MRSVQILLVGSLGGAGALRSLASTAQRRCAGAARTQIIGAPDGAAARRAAAFRMDVGLEDAKRNAMFDTLDAATRPDALGSLETRDRLTAAFLGHGVLVSLLNVVGEYRNYEFVAIGSAALLGGVSAVFGWFELASGAVEDDDRPGFAHERAIMAYTTSYLASVMWLSLRFSPLYPTALAADTTLDGALCVLSICCYVYGLASPCRTPLVDFERLTPTERLRMKGMIVSGLVGAVFILEALALLLNGGEAWWARVLALYPSQSVLEPSVTIFAAYAVEAGVLIHRLARRGVITFADAVPFYAKLVLPLLTLLPMGCLFVHKADEVSFWDFLFLGAG